MGARTGLSAKTAIGWQRLNSRGLCGAIGDALGACGASRPNLAVRAMLCGCSPRPVDVFAHWDVQNIQHDTRAVRMVALGGKKPRSHCYTLNN